MESELIPVKVGWQDTFSTFFIDLACPNEPKGCLSENIIKHGHDTSVKGHPQHYECKDCQRHFYPHTSGFFSQLEESINERLFSVLQDGKIDTALLGEILGSSPGTISKIMRTIVEKVANHPKTEIFWKSPTTAQALFIDETWINIALITWYLIVILNERGNVLAFELVKSRTSEKIIELIKRAERRLSHNVGLIATDDFSAYKGAMTGLRRNILHVRHIHQPPYGRIVIDQIEAKEKEIITTHIATTNDILLETNTFIVRISKSVKKIHERGKRGRKKGGKNRPKEIIEQEKRRKKKNKSTIKKGPKNPFKHGEIHVYHHDKKEGLFHPKYGSDEKVVSCLTELLPVFESKHITTNPVENVFSVFKKLIDFRGKRTLEYWQLLIRYFFTVREAPLILKEILHNLELSPQICHKASLKLLK
jgi:transposase-like protein